MFKSRGIAVGHSCLLEPTSNFFSIELGLRCFQIGTEQKWKVFRRNRCDQDFLECTHQWMDKIAFGYLWMNIDDHFGRNSSWPSRHIRLGDGRSERKLAGRKNQQCKDT